MQDKIIKHNIDSEQAEEQYNQVSSELNNTLRLILEIRRECAAFELRVQAECDKLKQAIKKLQ